MDYKVFYEVGDQIDKMSRLYYGVLSLDEQTLSIRGDVPVEVSLSAIETVEVNPLTPWWKQIKVKFDNKTLCLAVLQFRLKFIVTMCSASKTDDLYHQLQKLTL